MSEEEFHKELTSLKDTYNLSDVEISNSLRLPKPTIERWLSRLSSPHIHFRQGLIDELKDFIQNK